MAYTAIEAMRETNRARFGRDVGPMQPPQAKGKSENDLKSAALRFLHARCEGLRFDAGKAAEWTNDDPRRMRDEDQCADQGQGRQQPAGRSPRRHHATTSGSAPKTCS